MTNAVDLAAYFERIRPGGTVDRRYDALLRAHTGTFPFENLDVLKRENGHWRAIAAMP